MNSVLKRAQEIDEQRSAELMQKQPLFKVGDRPQWTPELIKQLPHETELKCAYFQKDIFTYRGQEIQYDFDRDLMIKNYFGVGSSAYFTHEDRSTYAEIISLPESYLNLEKPVEFEAGEIVEGSFDGIKWCDQIYVVFALGRHYCMNPESDGSHIHSYKFIRKIDPDKELKELADEVVKDHKSNGAWQFQDVKSMLIEMGKKVKSKNK